MFCIYLRTNSDLCHLQHKLIGFYNPDGKCLQRGTDWVFKYSGLRFVFRGVNEVRHNIRVSSCCRRCSIFPEAMSHPFHNYYISVAGMVVIFGPRGVSISNGTRTKIIILKFKVERA